MGPGDAEQVLDGRRPVGEVAPVDEAWQAGVVQVLDGELVGEARWDGLKDGLEDEKRQPDVVLCAVSRVQRRGLLDEAQQLHGT